MGAALRRSRVERRAEMTPSRDGARDSSAPGIYLRAVTDEPGRYPLTWWDLLAHRMRWSRIGSWVH